MTYNIGIHEWCDVNFLGRAVFLWRVNVHIFTELLRFPYPLSILVYIFLPCSVEHNLAFAQELLIISNGHAVMLCIHGAP